MTSQNPLPLVPGKTLGMLEAETTPCPLSDATWYRSDRVEDGIGWDVPPGTLSRGRWLMIDMLADGEEAFRQLRTLKAAVPVLMSSGYNEQEVTQRFVGKGLAGFIQKPYHLGQLRDCLRAAME